MIITYSYCFLNSTQTIWKSYRLSILVDSPAGWDCSRLVVPSPLLCAPCLQPAAVDGVLYPGSWLLLIRSPLVVVLLLLPAACDVPPSTHTNLLSLHLFINKIPLLTGDGIRFASSTLLPQQDVHIPILMFFYLCLAQLQNSTNLLVRLLFAQFCSNYLFITFYFACCLFCFVVTFRTAVSTQRVSSLARKQLFVYFLAMSKYRISAADTTLLHNRIP